MSGKFNPSPVFGGDESNHIIEIFLNALNDADGTALSKEEDSFNYAENFATARALADLWSANKRLSYQFDPNKMTDYLGRWENILNIIPDPDATDNQRRSIIAQRFADYGKNPNQQVITDLLRLLLGDIFAEIINSTYDIASGFVPGGEVIPGGANLADGDWSSSIAHLLIRVTQPANITDEKFYKTVGEIDRALENILPAWVNFEWGRYNSDGYGGFILDDPHNLDNEYFV